jgi:50S ribosomal subunit-associated GTPase HflX
VILFQKIILFVFNKIDVLRDEEILKELEDKFVDEIEKKIGLSRECIKNNIIKISAI